MRTLYVLAGVAMISVYRQASARLGWICAGIADIIKCSRHTSKRYGSLVIRELSLESRTVVEAV